jgi:hypothetical protein
MQWSLKVVSGAMERLMTMDIFTRMDSTIISKKTNYVTSMNLTMKK